MWTEQKIQQLRNLHAQGYSAGVMAHKMNISRNAIIGKCYREGLMFDKTKVGVYPGFRAKLFQLCKKYPDITIREAAERVGCSKTWVWKLIRKRGLPVRALQRGRPRKAQHITDDTRGRDHVYR